MNPRFYFATCQVGAEKAVKAEVMEEQPSLRFAFSRPGFITFKEESDASPALELKQAIFTRMWGEVVGQVKSEEALPELIDLIPAGSLVHGFERDLYVPGDDPDGFQFNEKITRVWEQLKSGAARDLRLRFNEVPKIGETVYDLIWIDDFHVFLGKHRHHLGLVGEPGNQPSIPLPQESPSRAYLKIEEAILRFQPNYSRGDQVLEVGCSPGGATTAMSARGLRVTGVDPKFMAKSVYELPEARFIQKCARDVKLEDLKGVNPAWIVMDMNIAPLEALDELGHVLSLLKKSHGKNLKLAQGFLTIKLNDWKFASSIRLYLKRVEELGFTDVKPIQLCSNRQEFFIYARYRSA